MLHDTVCHSCNSFFSGSLDLALARDGFEGLQRYLLGFKEPVELRRFRSGAVTARASDDDEFAGAEIRFGGAGGGLSASIAPSAAIAGLDGEEFRLFSEAEILGDEWLNEPVDPSRGVRLFGDTEALRRMREALERNGVHLTYRTIARNATRGEATVQFEAEITDEIRRGIAKIAFNYLAHHQGAEYALIEAFDPIRDFVRYGITPVSEPLDWSPEPPISVPGQPPDLAPVLHWTSLESSPHHRNLIGVVSLFGGITYHVMLAEDFDGPWFDLPLAHLYNLRDMRTRRMRTKAPLWRHRDR